MCISILEKTLLIRHSRRSFNPSNEHLDLIVEIKKHYAVRVPANLCGLVYLGDLMKTY